MEYVYPAKFIPNSSGFTIVYDDIPGCISEGRNIANAVEMAHVALYEYIEYLKDKGHEIPPASDMKDIKLEEGEFTSLIRVDIKPERAVRRTVSLPRWMDDRVLHEGLSLSRVLQDALSAKFA